MVKHRQLARQVGAFGEFASESSTDLVNMIFSTGSAFIFGLWICKADDNDKLQGRLLEDSDHHEDLFISATTTDQLSGRFAQLVMSNPTQISQLCASDSNSGSTSEMESYQSSFGKPSSFPAGLQNAASTYQEFNSENIQSSLENNPSSFLAGLQNAASTYQEFNSESIQSSFENSPSSFPTGLRNAASAYQEYNSKYIQSSLKKLGHGTNTSRCLSQGQASCPAATRAGSKPVV